MSLCRGKQCALHWWGRWMERQVRLQLGLRIRRTLVPTLKVALPTLKTILLGKRSAWWIYRLQLTCNGNVSQRHCFRIDRLQFPIWSIARIKELRRSAALIRRNESHWRSGITSWKGQVGRERCSFVSPLIENNEFPIRIFFVFYLRSDLTISSEKHSLESHFSRSSILDF